MDNRLRRQALFCFPTKKICPFLFNIEAYISNLLDQQNKFLVEFLTKLFFPILQPYKGFDINNFITLFIFRAPNPPFSLQKKMTFSELEHIFHEILQLIELMVDSVAHFHFDTDQSEIENILFL